MDSNTSNTKTIATVGIIVIVIIVGIMALWMDRKSDTTTETATSTAMGSSMQRQNNTVTGSSNTVTTTNTNTVAPTTAPSNQNILQTVNSMSNLTAFVNVAKLAGIEASLTANGPFTLFAPSNAAFEKLPKDLLALWMKPENKARLTSILNYHVVPGKFTSATLKDGQTLRTVFGQTLKVSKSTDGTISINGVSQVEMRDLGATNGNVFVVSSVLQPNLPTLK